MAVQEVTIFDTPTWSLPKDSPLFQKRTKRMAVSETSLCPEKQTSSPVYREVTKYIAWSHSCQICKTGAASRSAEQLGLMHLALKELPWPLMTQNPSLSQMHPTDLGSLSSQHFLNDSVVLIPKPWSGIGQHLANSIKSHHEEQIPNLLVLDRLY